jgi:hypothetical protein
MIEGEYESACTINAIISNLVPKAAAWGQRLEDTDMYFFPRRPPYHESYHSSGPHQLHIETSLAPHKELIAHRDVRLRRAHCIRQI